MHTEDLLLHIWKRALRVSEIERDSNFFDLGGDSLLAVNLLLEVERQTGVSIPITAIYDAPTVAEMARLIANEAPPESSSLVLLKPGTAEHPLFILHGIGGTVMELAALGRRIRIPDAVYAIQAHGLDGKEEPLTSIEEMAETYVRTIRERQPSGPYWLCGYSFGGLVAVEMARRLNAANHGIAALILIDSHAHPTTWPVLSRAKMRVRRVLHLFCRALRNSPGATLSDVRQRARAALARMRARSNGDTCRRDSARLHDWLLDQNPSLPLPLLQVREASGAALSAYRPTPYAGAITFLKANQRDTEFPDDPERIWRRLASQIEFRTIPGGHRTIVTTHADATATYLTACLWAAHRHPAAQSLPTDAPPFEAVRRPASQSQTV